VTPNNLTFYFLRINIMAKEIATTNANSVIASMPSFLQAKLGQNRQQVVSAEDVGIPRLKLMQPMSPEVDELDQTPGTFFNTATGEASSEIVVNNLGFQIHYVVGGDSAKGGTRDMFVGAFHSLAEAEAAMAESDDRDMLTISRSHRHILRIADTNEVVAMDFGTPTSVGVSRMWNTAIMADAELPRCARYWTLTAKKRKNEKGFWYAADFKRGDYVQTEDEYNKLVALEESFKEPEQLKAA
jgi:hypothetical protein